MKSVRSHKIDIIEDINHKLTTHGKNPLSSTDFDTLWDLDVDELIRAQIEIEELLKQSTVESS
jgi:hypothetical protein